MAKESAGILLYRTKNSKLEFLLVHPGGPFFRKKDAGHWTVPKGEIMENEDYLEAAVREFLEETGHQISGHPVALNPILQKGGKKVWCWAIEDDLDPDQIVSNTFEILWPPKSDELKSFPEIDKADWFDFDEAALKINERQIPFLDEVRNFSEVK